MGRHRRAGEPIVGLLEIRTEITQYHSNQVEKMKKKHIPQEMHPEQVRNIIKYIDVTQSESVKESIFSQLGRECFYTRKLNVWIGPYQENVQAFLDRVNIEKASKYWERLEYNEEQTVLILTGKKVAGCACAFAECAEPPQSLCAYCCKTFQEEMFGKLLGRKVEVEITEAYLLGDERCSTKIHLI